MPILYQCDGCKITAPAVDEPDTKLAGPPILWMWCSLRIAEGSYADTFFCKVQCLREHLTFASSKKKGKKA